MGIRDHRPKLEDVDLLTSLSDTLLPKKMAYPVYQYR